jgi:hypothetical protein
MKYKVPRDTEAEAAELSDPMVLKEWFKFFLKAKEGTIAIVISGIHHGIYSTRHVLRMTCLPQCK